jgi:hypothetical protein
MKKTFSFLFLMTLLTIAAHSQLYVGVGGMYGTSGITNQNTYGEAEMDYVMKPCWGVNLDVGYNFTKNLGILMEFKYQAMGQKYQDTQQDTVNTRDIDMNYFMMPILFKYRTGGKVARFYAMAGPQVGYLLGANQEYLRGSKPMPPFYQPETGDTLDVSEPDITDRYASIDIMGRLDLGAEVSLTGNLFLNVGLTMAYGFFDLNSTTWRYDDSSGNYNPSHNFYGGLNASICYRFDFKK